ncbi:unnamed protein product [Paramecium sonneborni]|uniref:Uncharacterized protein n=1 Tax=Paramecium sonneborni TaxID=65129 RepID=A0A8S1PEA0_9CILI|nr:unnamed protein product [Paramecium sonneborni]
MNLQDKQLKFLIITQLFNQNHFDPKFQTKSLQSYGQINVGNDFRIATSKEKQKALILWYSKVILLQKYFQQKMKMMQHMMRNAMFFFRMPSLLPFHCTIWITIEIIKCGNEN